MKITTILQIRWKGFVEEFALTDKDIVGCEVMTKEIWPKEEGGLKIDYKAEVTYRPTENPFRVDLTYEKGKQPNPNFFTDEMKIQWGTWEVSWNESDLSGTAVWKDEDPNYKPKDVGAVKVLQWRRPVKENRPRIDTQTIHRPYQSWLRDYLLRNDKCCAISGTPDKEALEVAHIIDAHLLDYDVTDNAILLRADLHRLFDARLINLHVHKGTATFVGSPKLSPEYKNLLKNPKNAKLDQRIFSRIAPAISVRSAQRQAGDK